MKNKSTLYAVITIMVARQKKHTAIEILNFLVSLLPCMREMYCALQSRERLRQIQSCLRMVLKWQTEKEYLAVMTCFTALGMAQCVCEISHR